MTCFIFFCLFHSKSLKPSVLFSTNGTAQLGLATFQELNSHTELVATVLDKVGRIRSPLCVRGALGSLLKLIGPQFVHLQNGDIIIPPPQSWCGE